MPQIGEQDRFEFAYMAKLRALVAQHGMPVEYTYDRATIDTGLHLYAVDEDRVKASHTRVWFQAKGIRASTLTSDSFATARSVARQVEVDHLRYWYAAPEPVYLVLYIESVDRFIAEDVREVVDRQWPGNSFYSAVPHSQRQVTVHVDASATLSETRVQSMLTHRSMRIDGPAFRGRPLGHRLDPIRSQMDAPEPALFLRLVDRLMDAHHFRVRQSVDVLPDLTVLHGRLFQTLEWQSPAFAEWGFGTSDFQDEPDVESMHGSLTLVVDSCPGRDDLPDHARDAVLEQIADRDLVGIAFNANDLSGTGGLWRSTLNDMSQVRPTQRHHLGLEALSNLLLICTLVYLDLAPEISWRWVNYR